jgi:hypothetical protein
MERHQRIQLKTTSRSTNQRFKVSPFQTPGFGVQQKAASTPASKAELWENYQRSSQIAQQGAGQTRSAIQAKLSIGQPGDKYEQEADSVADRVMAMSEPAQVQREELGEEEEELQMKPLAGTISPLVQREELPEDEEELQMKPEYNLVQREELPEEEEELQMKSLDNSIQREELPEEEEEIQMKGAATSNTPAATTSLEDRLSSSKGGGSPLSDDVRSFMEPRFGADFSGVRVHTGSDAVQMNQDVSAQAFAHGSDVYFGAGKAPGKDALTAHELTHVVQQGGSQVIDNKNGTAVAKKEVIQRQNAPQNKPVDVSANIKKINESVDKIRELAEKIRKENTHGWWWPDNKEKLNTAANLTAMASKIISATSALDNICGGNSNLGSTEKALEAATKILNTLADISQQDSLLMDMQNNPNDFGKAAAWATNIGNVFDQASNLFPPKIAGLPIIPEYIKGLLSAPKNYIQTFIALQQDRINKIDSETGGTKADERLSDDSWKGPLTRLYGGAYALDDLGDADNFQKFMKDNKTIRGKDLWETSKDYGKSLLLGAVQGVPNEKKREKWSEYINKWN